MRKSARDLSNGGECESGNGVFRAIGGFGLTSARFDLNNGRMRTFLLAVVATLVVFGLGCASGGSDKKKTVERGHQGTIAYSVSIETSEPGVKIEAEGSYIGTAPTTLKIFGDKDGTFHNFGNNEYVIRALPARPGQFIQTKIYRTGAWFSPEDRIPSRVYFDMNLTPIPASANSPAPVPFPSYPDTRRRTGTGFFITDDGYILTSLHVVENTDKISIKLGDQNYPATIVRKDKLADLAVLKISHDSVGLPLANARAPRQGQRVFTTGFPNPAVQGEEPKFTEGSVSSLRGFMDDTATFQFSAPVQPGNSGGPLVNSEGSVIGIVVAKLLRSELVNYAIKSTRANLLLEEIDGLNLKVSQTPGNLSPEEIAEKLKQSVVMVVAE